MEIIEIEGKIDPKKLGINLDDPEAWKIYAEKVRDIISECAGIPKSQYGYRNWKTFEKHFNKELAKLDGKIISEDDDQETILEDEWTPLVDN